MTAQTAQALRQQAADLRQRSAESWERSDTDGFLSQWASDVTARLYEAQADLVDAGGMDEFPALFDLEGNLIPAKYIQTRFGFAWALLDGDDPHGRFVGFFNESNARKADRRRANDAKKGYQVGTVKAPAKAKIVSNGVTAGVAIVRTDGGFSADAEIVGTDTHYQQDW